VRQQRFLLKRSWSRALLIAASRKRNSFGFPCAITRTFHGDLSAYTYSRCHRFWCAGQSRRLIGLANVRPKRQSQLRNLVMRSMLVDYQFSAAVSAEGSLACGGGCSSIRLPRYREGGSYEESNMDRPCTNLGADRLGSTPARAQNVFAASNWNTVHIQASVVKLLVPDGTYVINAKVSVHNLDSDPQPAVCGSSPRPGAHPSSSFALDRSRSR